MRTSYWFIDIDGTLTSAKYRENRATSMGLAVGPYGTPERYYPHGKQAFYSVFGDSSFFHTDVNMEGADKFIHRLEEITASAHIIVLTARPEAHAQATHSDLQNRGLWLPNMRLICKPADWPKSSASFKATAIAQEAEIEGFDICFFVDNCKANRDAVSSVVECTSFSSCSHALEWLEQEALNQDGEVNG